MTYQPERDVAVTAVVKACRLCESVRASLVSAETISKRDKSPVTVADFGAQAVITAELHAAFGDIPLVAEEDAAVLRTKAGAALKSKVVDHVQRAAPDLSEERIVAAIDAGAYGGGAQGRHWTLDPIDGTKGFLRGDQYAIALALIEDGRVVLGVLGCPHLPVDARRSDGPAGCIFVAAQGAGTAMRALDDEAETPVRVSDVANPSRASFCESVEAAHTAHGDAARIAAVLGVTAPPFRIDSQCKYAAIARGDSSIYLRLPTRADYQEKIWDHAAGWIVVYEAGGKVTDVRGRPLDFSTGRTLRRNSGVVATNGKLHDRVIRAVHQVLGTG